MPAYKVARRGMVRTFQLTKALSRLTVIENMRSVPRARRARPCSARWSRPCGATRRRSITEKADALLARFLLDTKREDFAGSLSGGQRKLLEMARALMAEPEMVMLDEPMAGVNPALKQSLLGHVKSLRDEGRTVLFVEHDMDMVRDISDWVIVMAQGKIVAEGPPGHGDGRPASDRCLSRRAPRQEPQLRGGGADSRRGQRRGRAAADLRGPTGRGGAP